MHHATQLQHQIRPSDIDGFGHVNHAKSIELLELGRFDWLSQNRLPLDPRWTPVVTRIDVAYRREMHLSEVTIRTDLAELKQYTAQFQQAIHLAGVDGPAVSACISVSFLDSESRRPVRLRDIESLRAGQAR